MADLRRQRERNWLVPVSVKERYWAAEFYAGGYVTAAEAEQSVRTLVEQLPVVLDGRGEFLVGPAVRV